jgi:hypothetical protein
MISSPPAVGSRTSRDTAAGSWYGAGMIWSVILAPWARLAALRCLAGAAGCELVHEDKQQVASTAATAMPNCRRADIQALPPTRGTTLVRVAEPDYRGRASPVARTCSSTFSRSPLDKVVSGY